MENTETDIYTLYRKGVTWRIVFKGDEEPIVTCERENEEEDAK